MFQQNDLPGKSRPKKNVEFDKSFEDSFYEKAANPKHQSQ